jgi:hypothetical protein
MCFPHVHVSRKSHGVHHETYRVEKSLLGRLEPDDRGATSNVSGVTVPAQGGRLASVLHGHVAYYCVLNNIRACSSSLQPSLNAGAAPFGAGARVGV